MANLGIIATPACISLTSARKVERVKPGREEGAVSWHVMWCFRSPQKIGLGPLTCGAVA